MGEQAKQSIQASGGVSTDWADFRQSVTFDELITEISETLEAIGDCWASHPGLRIDPEVRVMKAKIESFLEAIKAKEDRPERPAPETVEAVLWSLRQVRKTIPAS